MLSRIYDVPFQVGRKARHQSCVVLKRRWWCMRDTLQLRYMSQRRNILPAGTTYLVSKG